MSVELKRFKEKLALGEPIIGTHVNLADSSITELMGIIGFEFVWIENEHSASDRQEVLRHIIAARAAGIVSIVRVAWNDPVLTKLVLEMGPDGIVFPFIRSVEEAKLAIASCLYPPKGIRGYGPMRAGYLPRETTYAEEYEESLFKILQIEHIDAVNCLDEIVKLPGVDGIVLGPMDLSASIGKLGQLRDPEMLELYDRIAAVAKGAGIPYGTSYDYDETFVNDWVKRGAQFMAIRSDVGFIRADGARTLATTKKMIDEQRGR